jgi:CheY-like chemotaxis protein
MNGIIGFAELALENTDTTGQTRDYLEKILASTKDLLSILNDILDISKIEAGKVSLETIPFNLHDLLVACENTIGLKAAEKGVNLYIYSEPFIEYKLLGDPTKLRQILLNLLSNAIKFTNVGTVKLMVTAEKSLAGKIFLRFEIKDSGIGMTQAQMASIFTPFEQADRGTTRRFGGTGLGLPITKNLVELMGGTLLVESAPGIGSKFSFTLEFDLSDKKAEIHEKEPKAVTIIQRPVFSGRILVCEDNTMNQEVIKDHLERIGLKVDIRVNGQQGVVAIQESMKEDRPYELILMDIHMPVMDGLEASSEIKRLGCSTPIVALTANVLTQDTDIYYRYGIVDHLGKPFTAQELWNCLSRYLTPIAMTTLPVPGSAAVQEESRAAKPDAGSGDSDAKEDNTAIDYQAGLNMTAGNQALYDKLRHDFYIHNRNFFEAFCALLGEGIEEDLGFGQDSENIVTAHRLVHTLKSSAALIGAEKLRASAAEIELPLKTGKADYTPEQLTNLQNALEATLAELEKEISGGA